MAYLLISNRIRDSQIIPSSHYRKSLSSSSIWRQMCNGSITGHLVLREYNRVTFREFTQTRDIYVSHFEWKNSMRIICPAVVLIINRIFIILMKIRNMFRRRIQSQLHNLTFVFWIFVEFTSSFNETSMKMNLILQMTSKTCSFTSFYFSRGHHSFLLHLWACQRRTKSWRPVRFASCQILHSVLLDAKFTCSLYTNAQNAFFVLFCGWTQCG
jgi:hypothetical protein